MRRAPPFRQSGTLQHACRPHPLLQYVPTGGLSAVCSVQAYGLPSMYNRAVSAWAWAARRMSRGRAAGRASTWPTATPPSAALPAAERALAASVASSSPAASVACWGSCCSLLTTCCFAQQAGPKPQPRSSNARHFTSGTRQPLYESQARAPRRRFDQAAPAGCYSASTQQCSSGGAPGHAPPTKCKHAAFRC